MTTALLGIAAALAIWPHESSWSPQPIKTGRLGPTRGRIDRVMPQILGAVVAMGLAGLDRTPSGIAVGLCAGAGTFVLLRALRRRAAASAQHDDSLPLVLTVAALLLRSGTPPTAALAGAARGCRSPVAGLCGSIERRVAMGESASSAWSEAAREPGLTAAARAAIRAGDSGAALAAAWESTAAQLRIEHRLSLEIKARKVGVHALAPLGLCFLPSFICLGVIPIVIGLAADIL